MSKRSYQQFCGLALALDVVGERWTLLAVRNLLLGPRRYKQLMAGLPGITTNLLAKRLKEMESAGLIAKDGRLYSLTEMGLELEPAVMALAAFGGRYMTQGPMPGQRLDMGWAMVSMKRRYQGEGTGSIGVTVAERSFQLDYRPADVVVREQEPTCDLNVSGPMTAFGPWFFGGPPSEITVVGPGFETFCTRFGLREPLPLKGAG